MQMANPRNLRFTVNVPDYFTADQRREVGSQVVFHILKRTQQENQNKAGKPFRKYTKEYTESLNFKIAGKSASDINLTLSGDMLSDLDIIEHGMGYIDIGYKDGYYGAGKVEGNVIGSYGQAQGHPSMARNFLGIEKSDLKSIIDSVDTMKEEDLKKNKTIEEQATIIAESIELETNEEI
jgi:hypothetical protein